ncbi:hypothetical protein GCM10023175_05300 [Pseudonocardia xishanensis]|uniref:Uncharacterized protein n=1 Tax=Pseudonocardia xishanensis TaxID=630995 RepID=A0ABP8RFA8_9PSEU
MIAVVHRSKYITKRDSSQLSRDCAGQRLQGGSELNERVGEVLFGTRKGVRTRVKTDGYEPAGLPATLSTTDWP